MMGIRTIRSRVRPLLIPFITWDLKWNRRISCFASVQKAVSKEEVGPRSAEQPQGIESRRGMGTFV